jgi:hypothetical protein
MNPTLFDSVAIEILSNARKSDHSNWILDLVVSKFKRVKVIFEQKASFSKKSLITDMTSLLNLGDLFH